MIGEQVLDSKSLPDLKEIRDFDLRISSNILTSSKASILVEKCLLIRPAS